MRRDRSFGGRVRYYYSSGDRREPRKYLRRSGRYMRMEGLPLLQPVATEPPGDVLAGALDTGRLTRQVKRPIFDR